MRLSWVLMFVAACSFDHGRPGARSDGNETPFDMQPVTDAELDGPDRSSFCDEAGGSLVACYEFEDNAQDASGHDLHATTSNVTFPAGKVGKALQLMDSGGADVAENAMFDVSAVTVEAWIRLTQQPGPGKRAGILDNNGQYGFFLHENGRIQCTVGNMTVAADGVITTNTWTHVACTYDGTDSALYVNGRTVAITTGGSPLSTSGTTGISIAADNPPGSGSRLAGQIDQLRIFSVARASSQICLAADGDDCL